jgi:hypothetical protein
MFEQLEEPKEKKPTDYSGLIIGLAVLPVMLIFYWFDKDDLALSVAMVLGSILLAIRVRWDLRKRIWFWGIIVLVSLLHIPLVLRIQWPSGWIPGVALMPIGLADCLIILGIVRFVEKYIVRTAPPNEEV